jgi:DNA-binding GntR family transcriptional regulator
MHDRIILDSSMATAVKKRTASQKPDTPPVDDATPEGKDGLGSPEKVEMAILNGIQRGQYVPGQHLVEIELTRNLGVSRGSLREGFRRLASRGVITITRHRGAYISKLSRAELDDLLSVLEVLCCLAASQAAERCGTPSMRKKMEQLLRRIEAYDVNAGIHDFLELRHDFYNTLIGVSGNSELERIVPLARADLYRLQIYSSLRSYPNNDYLIDYVDIVREVIDQKPVAAAKLIQRHFKRSRKIADTVPKTAFNA